MFHNDEQANFTRTAGFMSRSLPAVCLLLGAVFLSPGIYPQEEKAQTALSQTIPGALQKPDRGEAPRYPQDLVIGELGQGKAPADAYRFARDILGALVAGDKTASILKNSEETPGSVLTNELFKEISDLEVRSSRIGGGKVEADGSVSFLIRILGSTESITGELFLREEPVTPAVKAPAAPAKEPAENSPEEPAVASVKEPSAKEPTEKPVAADDSNSPKTRWLIDDLILEEKRALTELKDSYRYDFSPYERFF